MGGVSTKRSQNLEKILGSLFTRYVQKTTNIDIRAVVSNVFTNLLPVSDDTGRVGDTNRKWSGVSVGALGILSLADLVQLEIPQSGVESGAFIFHNRGVGGVGKRRRMIISSHGGQGSVGVSIFEPLLQSIPASSEVGTAAHRIVVGGGTIWRVNRQGSLAIGTIPGERISRGTIGIRRLPTGTYDRLAVGSLTVRTSIISGTVSAVRVTAGTLGVARIPTGTFNRIAVGSITVRTSINSDGNVNLDFRRNNVLQMRFDATNDEVAFLNRVDLRDNNLEGVAKMTSTSGSISNVGVGTLNIRTPLLQGTVPAGRILRGTMSLRRMSIETGTIRAGTTRYVTFTQAFAASPNVALTPVTLGTPRIYAVPRRRPGSFSVTGTPTGVCMYIAVIGNRAGI